jgi:hypothetical protein
MALTLSGSISAGVPAHAARLARPSILVRHLFPSPVNGCSASFHGYLCTTPGHSIAISAAYLSFDAEAGLEIDSHG